MIQGSRMCPVGSIHLPKTIIHTLRTFWIIECHYRQGLSDFNLKVVSNHETSLATKEEKKKNDNKEGGGDPKDSKRDRKNKVRQSSKMGIMLAPNEWAELEAAHGSVPP